MVLQMADIVSGTEASAGLSLSQFHGFAHPAYDVRGEFA